ncbi:MAG: hypothetical protein ACYC1U_09275 [Candidatus Aquicultorales bacterium]
MKIIIMMGDVPIKLLPLDVITFAISIIVAIAGLVTGLLSRRIWRMVEGELAASWRWVLPGFGLYMVASGLRVLSIFFGNEGIQQLATQYLGFVEVTQLSTVFSVMQAMSEFAFLAFIVFGLVRQYRLFASLSLREQSS